VAEGKDTKETRNDHLDYDGCPDEKTEKPKAKEIKRGKMVLKGVTFEKNSVTLRDESYKTLKEVFESLKAYPEVKVEIRGYTDNRGGREHNRKLSQGRAESVKQYLVTKGIDPSRLKVKGFGSANPIASNKTAAGRAKNRRIEFFRID
jgi:outer membrane protein OmpA-like peptidoglycan-associated protein